MDEITPAVATLQTQYLASRQEASACRSTAEQYTARAVRADEAAESFKTALAALGGALPLFPPPADPEDGDYPSTPSAADGTISA